jgi:AraC-like DNA-binding protein
MRLLLRTSTLRRRSGAAFPFALTRFAAAHTPQDLRAPDVAGFWLVVLSGGALTLRTPGRARLIDGPALICVNDRARLRATVLPGARGACIFFHPRVVNSRFSFTAIRRHRGLSETDQHDLVSLAPFLGRDPDALPAALDRSALTRVEERLATLERELTAQDNPVWLCRARVQLFALLYLAAAGDGLSSAALHELPRGVARAVQFLHTHFGARISAAEIARAAGLGRTQLFAQFRRALNDSPRQYLLALRLRAATQLLRDTRLSVSEAAEGTGFPDLAHFNRSFRRHFHTTPARYRRVHGVPLP